jgi:hypothetical protein
LCFALHVTGIGELVLLFWMGGVGGGGGARYVVCVLVVARLLCFMCLVSAL